jgi:diguanylate cyclase (GGDEF)-like protein
VPTFVIDADHRVTHWNLAMESLTGFTAAEMVGTRMHWKAFYASEQPLMADLVVDNANEEAIGSYYHDNYRKSTLIDSAYEVEKFFPGLGASGRWLFFTAAPIHDGDGIIIGAVQTLLDVTERKLAEEDIREREKRYKELSITDSLTKLYNSRHFFRQLRQEVDRANRYGQPLSLVLLDIDNFKRYNDTYGHMEGDRVLSVLAEVIRGNVRSTDTAFRYGGEEFTVILPQTEIESAMAVAERLRESFAKTVLTPLPDVAVSMTVSIGVSRYIPAEKDSVFIKRADAGMYTAKQRGKNQVFFAI